MNASSQNIGYSSTGFFSKLVTDYINQSAQLQPFYSFAPTIDGIKKAIEERKKFPTNRNVLVEILQKQYAESALTAKQELNIRQLKNENCFTITTAHQPNIFTGPLYFIYKILHAIKLAEDCKLALPGNDFVPVYYMGSEDADLDELGHIFINGKKHEWQTAQTGAVGRMKIDKALVNLIDSIAGEILIHPFGKIIIEVIKQGYSAGSTMEQATFKLVNFLFAQYGLLMVLPDNAELKKLFTGVVKKELEESFSYKQVQQTVAAFPAAYKVQAGGRELNLFYLKDNRRDRVEVDAAIYKVVDSNISFTQAEILQELQDHPERFSANVILRPVFQEMILPNVAFIGGGGEIAYWLELKKVFEAVQVPFPVLVLRNSFLIIDADQSKQVKKIGITSTDLFKQEQELVTEMVRRETNVQLSLQKEQEALQHIYEKIKSISAAVDITLAKHTEALQVNALKKITVLETKMLRAEKRKFEAQQRQLHKLKTTLFPKNNLQERIENFIPFYAKWGDEFIKAVYKNSLGLEQDFVIMELE